VGVLVGYLPFHLCGGGRWRRAAIFAGGALSVLVSALLALAELRISRVPMPGAALGLSAVVFLISAALEGAITLAVIQALEKIQPNFVRRPAFGGRSFALGSVSVAAILLAAVGVVFASTDPDGIERLTHYEAAAQLPWLSKAAAGLGGLTLIYVACLLIGRLVSRRGSV
jgi:hypothetical protein